MYTIHNMVVGGRAAPPGASEIESRRTPEIGRSQGEMMSRNRWVAGSIAALAALGLYGCGGSSNSNSGSAASGTGTSGTSGTSGGGAALTTLVDVSSAGVPSLDNENFGTSTQQEVLTNVGEPMLRFKPLSTKGPQGDLQGNKTQFVGGACQHAALQGATLSCTLGNFTSPYGNKLTSQDVKWTFEYIIATKGIGLTGLQLASVNLKDPVTILSPSRLKINLTKHNTNALAAMTFWTMDPMDAVEIKKHATKKDPLARNWLAGHTAMFGPYQVTQFTPNQQVTLEANPNYKGDPSAGVVPPSIKHVDYRFVSSDATRAQLLASGAAQITKSVNLNMFLTLQGKSDITRYSLPYLAAPTLYFNVTKPPFNNLDLRKAITCAVNRQAISTNVYHGHWKPTHTIVGTKLPSSDPSFDTCPQQNIAKSKTLLKAAGYNGATLPLYYSVGNSGQDAQQNATLIQAQLSQAGIKTSLQAVPDATKYFEGSIAGSYGMFIFLYGANVPTPTWLLGSWFGPGSPINFTKLNTPQMTTLLNRMEAAPLGSAKMQAASRAYQKIYMQNAAVVPLVQQLNEYVINNTKVCGFRSDPGDFIFWQFLKPCS